MKYSPSVSQAQQPGKREDMIRSGKPTTEERVNKIDMQCNVNECNTQNNNASTRLPSYLSYFEVWPVRARVPSRRAHCV